MLVNHATTTDNHWNNDQNKDHYWN